MRSILSMPQDGHAVKLRKGAKATLQGATTSDYFPKARYGRIDTIEAGFETAMSTHSIAFYKPYGVLPCFTDSEGRPTLADYITVPRVYAAGRLDQDSEGLMILTSNGALAHRITDPQHKLPKVYLVQVERIPDEPAIERLCTGVLLAGKRTRPAQVKLLDTEPPLPERPVRACARAVLVRAPMRPRVRRDVD